MMGLEVEGKPLMRAYSIASANHDEYLEFFSIRVFTRFTPPGPQPSRTPRPIENCSHPASRSHPRFRQ